MKLLGKIELVRETDGTVGEIQSWNPDRLTATELNKIAKALRETADHLEAGEFF